MRLGGGLDGEEFVFEDRPFSLRPPADSRRISRLAVCDFIIK